jgi:hypothetical protein
MNDKVVWLVSTVEEQQAKIEGLTERVIRLGATLELLMRTGGRSTKNCHVRRQENDHRAPSRALLLVRRKAARPQEVTPS